MSDINIGDMLYDWEAEGNVFGMVVEDITDGWYIVEWNDGSRMNLYCTKIRPLKKEYGKLKRKCLTVEKK